MLDTCDAMLLIVKDWLKWVKMKTWSHSGRCLVCKWLKFFFGNPDINGSGSPNSQRARLPRNILDGSNVSVHMRVSSHFLSSHLATASSFTQPSSLHPPPPPPPPLSHTVGHLPSMSVLGMCHEQILRGSGVGDFLTPGSPPSF